MQQEEFGIQNIYVKDISFEAPNSPEIFMEDWKPKMEYEISNDIKQLEEKVFDIVLNITVTVKSEEKTAFLVEVHQAGIFVVSGFAEDQLKHMLNTYCPTILYPYAREMISSIVTKGGFQPLLLAPINFEALYAEQQQKQSDQPTTLH
ncbi:protein-export chaperone SecB [Candidatus Marithrix sp. Canyon 246]|uniref:protein-export chaperone SecB n=1 Tax=Candidatus Marithrix sp. Canyon 246 TaxID=1827136 RepID=UPI00084A12E6|nr:protein-export chaperone SecB [Candidatus Marithrix sp. Canyon 246]